MKLCTSQQEAIEFTSKRLYLDVAHISTNMSLFQFKTNYVYHKISIISGFIILDISKVELNKVPDMLKSAFDDCKVLSGETDTLTIFIKHVSKSFLNTLRSMQNRIDFSKLRTRHQL
jgi:hypothetical protein